MYLTMNRFRVAPGKGAVFEAIWTGRDSHLSRVEGFLSFHLFKGPLRADHRLYASHTLWTSEAVFAAWTRSEAFRASHRGAGGHGEVYLGHPELETFESIQHIGA